ncbi:MAG: peptidoglycan DD-metalloendopeptidase family protein [Gemmatimonadota bacterium]|nr:peptidoglycan DD-metalloendopeptidase family protein [Gemmatimonadota bacterium]
MGRGPTNLAFMLAVFGSACASIPEAPQPVGAPAAPDVASAEPLRIYTPVEQAEATRVPAPYPALPLSVGVSPRRPRQASVVTVRIIVPPGPALERPTATLAERDVLLVRDDLGWIGLAGLPVDGSGLLELDIRGRRNGVEEHERRVIRVEAREYPSTRIRISAGAASDPEVDARIARERQLIRSRLTASTDVWLPEDPFDWPRPPVRTSPFGEGRVFNGAVRSRHLGLDLRGRRGQGTYAPAAGRVLLTGSFFYQGNAVYLDHGLGLVTAYFHHTSIVVEEGDIVSPGQLLGRVGSTGRSTAPHLHWSAYVNGESVDPESLIGFLLIPKTAADVEAAETQASEDNGGDWK